ncbi:DUF402 domain-containing protein [Nocardioides sp. CPCC 205120]|uniref:DUF402 domain-containing protein n=1 Tax=Nocardioides sp. CPCC 205120 TaxID=3406462 RepID=UPI003B50F424
MSPVHDLAPGTRVRVAMTKWGGAPHWEYDAFHLGHDRYGEWLGAPAGTRHARPGLEFDAAVDKVVVVSPEHHRVVALHAPGIWCALYADMATPPTWDLTGPVPVLRSVDLDLDVVRRDDGTVYVDDEDEFAEHLVTLGYPAEVAAAAERSCAEVLAGVRAGDPPYDAGSAAPWFAVLRRVLAAGGGAR